MFIEGKGVETVAGIPDAEDVDDEVFTFNRGFLPLLVIVVVVG